MSLLRTFLVAILVVAVLPWGAYLAKAPANGAGIGAAMLADGATGDGESAVLAPDRVAIPAIKCRKGLPASPCMPDAKALVPAWQPDRPPVPRQSARGLHAKLPGSRTDRPALPPPRLA